jgi:hypothetical protein
VNFAYADPPYFGQGRKLYGHPEWDTLAAHKDLIEGLSFFQGWALSASSVSLPMLLPLCPTGVRVCAWVKTFCAFKPNVGLAYSWEPVIVFGGRRIGRDKPTVRDWLGEPITLKKGLTGAKPPRFCRWVFSVLNATEAEDTLFDMFPGTGIVGREWLDWRSEACPVEIGGNRRP